MSFQGFWNDYYREKPLALYVFAGNDKVYEEFKDKTSSGSFGFNECLMQVGFECMPFGGVGIIN